MTIAATIHTGRNRSSTDNRPRTASRAGSPLRSLTNRGHINDHLFICGTAVRAKGHEPFHPGPGRGHTNRHIIAESGLPTWAPSPAPNRQPIWSRCAPCNTASFRNCIIF